MKKELNERACELVFEALTGECWHRWEENKSDATFVCGKCEGWFNNYTSRSKGVPNVQIYEGKNGWPTNPDLLDSLDAWVPLWEMMGEDNKYEYSGVLAVIQGETKLFSWEAKPHHHLEAALRTLKVECPDCGGERHGTCKKGIPVIRRHPTKPCANDDICQEPCIVTCTCTNGKRSLWDIWEAGV